MYIEREELEEILSKYLNQKEKIQVKIREFETKTTLDNQQIQLRDMLNVEELMCESFIADLKGLLDD